MLSKHLIFLFIVSTGCQSFAKSWNLPSLLSTANKSILKVGETNFGLAALYGEYKERYTQSGSLERVSKVNKSREGVKRNTGDYQYDTHVTRTIYVTQLEYGILSDWTLGVQLPLLSSEFKKQYTIAELDNKTHNTRLGNVELVSKKSILEFQQHRLVFAQRLDFPALIEDNQEEEIQRAQERLGYAIGLGFTLDSLWSKDWRTAVHFMVDYTFEDRVRLNDSNNKLTRNPGDEVYLEVSVANALSRNIEAQVVAATGYKFKDKYKGEVNMDGLEKNSTVYQNVGEFRLAYKFPKTNELSSQHIAELKYHGTLSGKNVDNLDLVGLRWQVLY